MLTRIVMSIWFNCISCLVPQVADVCSIICFTDWIAFSLAFQATNGALATAVTVAERKIAERNRRKKFDRIYLQRFLQIGIAWLLFVAAASQFMTSASIKKELGILAVAKARPRV